MLISALNFMISFLLLTWAGGGGWVVLVFIVDLCIRLGCSFDVSLVSRTSLVAQTVKQLAYNAGDLGLIPGTGRSSGEGNVNPLQYSCLENPKDRGAWWATVHRVAKSWTRLSDFTHFHLFLEVGLYY